MVLKWRVYVADPFLHLPEAPRGLTIGAALALAHDAPNLPRRCQHCRRSMLTKLCVGRRGSQTCRRPGTSTSLARRESPGAASGRAARRKRAPAPTCPDGGAGVPPHRFASSALVPPPGTAPSAPTSRLKTLLDPREDGRQLRGPGGGREGGTGRPRPPPGPIHPPVLPRPRVGEGV